MKGAQPPLQLSETLDDPIAVLKAAADFRPRGHRVETAGSALQLGIKVRLGESEDGGLARCEPGPGKMFERH